jgi:hypothetical protein
MSAKRAALIAAAIFLAPAAAFAAHGKVGLWSSTTTANIPGLPPQKQTSTYCMTQAEVNSNEPVNRNPDCTYSNVRSDGRTFSADMVCKGQLNATGHLTTTYDSDTHYTASVTINTGDTSLTNAVEGKWVKADCAGAQH